MNDDREQKTASVWSVLREPLFGPLWAAGVVSNIGTWMQNVGAAWFMTSLSASPMLVALMQTATSLPIMLLGLPAGALADIVDRRRMLLVTQVWMLAAAATLAALTFAGAVTATSLLALTFLLGLGAAVTTPAWQAITPELVPREKLPAAVALSSVSVNIARAVGPALGGVIVATGGPGWVFLLNAVSFAAVIVVVQRWKPSRQPATLPPESVPGAMWAGWQYVRFSEPVRAALVRAAIFVSGASALWALLPVVARGRLGAGAVGYGLLYGSIGIGAVLGVALARWRGRFSFDAVAAAATVMFAAATVALATLQSLPALAAVMVVAGVAWMSIMVGFNVIVLGSSPRWVQARCAGLYMMVFQGTFALGSAVWGVVAEHFGGESALLAAAATLVAGLVVARRWPISDFVLADLSPSLHWAEPAAVTPPAPDDGPVLVTVEYRIDPARGEEFAVAMSAVRRLRLRDGATRWGLFRQPADPAHYVETFLVDSWLEHLRQHQRVTVADRETERRARAFHVGEAPPVVTHWIAERRVP